jgi:hypothetical protein
MKPTAPPTEIPIIAPFDRPPPRWDPVALPLLDSLETKGVPEGERIPEKAEVPLGLALLFDPGTTGTVGDKVDRIATPSKSMNGA